jgi:hypothetical protein
MFTYPTERVVSEVQEDREFRDRKNMLKKKPYLES